MGTLGAHLNNTWHFLNNQVIFYFDPSMLDVHSINGKVCHDEAELIGRGDSRLFKLPMTHYLYRSGIAIGDPHLASVDPRIIRATELSKLQLEALQKHADREACFNYIKSNPSTAPTDVTIWLEALHSGHHATTMIRFKGADSDIPSEIEAMVSLKNFTMDDSGLAGEIYLNFIFYGLIHKSLPTNEGEFQAHFDEYDYWHCTENQFEMRLISQSIMPHIDSNRDIMYQILKFLPWQVSIVKYQVGMVLSMAHPVFNKYYSHSNTYQGEFPPSLLVYPHTSVYTTNTEAVPDVVVETESNVMHSLIRPNITDDSLKTPLLRCNAPVVESYNLDEIGLQL